MARTLQFKRYGSATIANTTGANGELIINSTNQTITVHDGVTPGGYATLNSVTDNNIDQYARNTANTNSNNISIIQGVNTTQNSSISILQDVNTTQNTRLNSIETINTNQNTNISIIQGVNDTQNTSISIIQGVNTTQNTNITNATNLAQSAYNYANTIVSDTQIDPYARTTANSASNNITIIQGVNSTQNTNINNASNLAQAAFDKANTALANTTGSWTVTAGANTYSFTVPSDGTYTMWVKGNIANGIIIWNATLSISNSNVPAIGTQYAWNYTGGGSPILLTTLPNQIRGTANTISTDNTYVGSTSNRFDFGISNSSGSSQTIYYGYTKI